ncbi:FAD binding domain-containing protein [Pseudomonas sp. HN2-3]|uniref:FAD binding domain-containing protein n=1 Tax=Pseudomonas sp. HN2-3 TaxID=2886360 RepID=UPI001D10C953|nr:FAD binding domain-containing protein [Pseudomonas sp. HN2-3]UDU83120.1 FAD binding domain-containing protein [Pseudomonas sp. HN2-3]
MDERNVRKALIIGGSLGGLFVANALRTIGWQVDVFERSPTALDSRGGGIVLQPEVVNAFRFSEIPTSHALGVRSKNRIYLSNDGAVRHKQVAPQTQTSWSTLYSHLLAALPDEHYHRGKKLVDLKQDEDGVVALFEDGTTATGDILVGADGGGSTVRQLVSPDSRPTYSGYVVWRGLVDERDLLDEAKNRIYEDFVFQQNPGSLMLEYMVPGTDGATEVGERRFNWLWYRKASKGPVLDAILTDKEGRRRDHSVPPGALSEEQETAFRKFAEEHTNPAFRQLIRQTQEIFVQSIMDLKVSQMVFNRVLLVGDAAFIPRPHTAGSTAKAAANAVALAKALTENTPIDEGLRRWQRTQMDDGARMSDWGVDMGNRIMGIGEFSGAA